MLVTKSTPRVRARAAFSWLALVLLASVVGVLMLAAVPATRQVRSGRAVRDTQVELERIVQASGAFFRDVRRLPDDVEELSSGDGVLGWDGPYLESTEGLPGELARDGWGRAYRFVAVGDRLEVRSAGADGELGTRADMVEALDVSWMRVEETIDALREIERALALYNGQYVETDPLPADWGLAMQRLVDEGLLADERRLRNDGWGLVFEADPPAVVPLRAVRSPRLDRARAGEDPLP